MNSPVVEAHCPNCNALLQLLAGGAYRCDYCDRVFQPAAGAAAGVAVPVERPFTPEFELARKEAETLIPKVEQLLRGLEQKLEGTTDATLKMMSELATRKVLERVKHVRDAIAARDTDAIREDLKKLEMQVTLLTQNLHLTA